MGKQKRRRIPPVQATELIPTEAVAPIKRYTFGSAEPDFYFTVVLGVAVAVLYGSPYIFGVQLEFSGRFGPYISLLIWICCAVLIFSSVRRGVIVWRYERNQATRGRKPAARKNR